jgi:hypothetical protein
VGGGTLPRESGRAPCGLRSKSRARLSPRTDIGTSPKGESPKFARRPTGLPTLAVAGYLICIPEIARAMTSRWISEVPSKIV